MLSHTLTAPTTRYQRHMNASSDNIRRRALTRLYQRRSAVDHLIASLERYQREQIERRAEIVPISVGERS